MADFHGFVNDFVTGTYDFGTEFGLGKVRPMLLSTILPWIRAPDPPDHHEDEDDFNAPVDAEDDPMLSIGIGLDHTISVPGLLHILHNAGNDMIEQMPELDAAVDGLAKVATLLRHPGSKRRLIESCFTGPVTRHFAPHIKSFKSKVYKHRWAIVSFAVGEIMETQAGLRRGWSLEKYKALGSDKQQLSKDVVAVDECIRDVGHWWSKIKTLEKIYKLMRLFF